MTVRPDAIAREHITLGILAGGRATRLGGRDKAWLQREGVAQVVRLAQRFGAETGAVLVSANRELPRYAQAGIEAVPDRIEDAGPLGGLDALAAACRTPWLLTLPVDLVDANDCLLRTLVSAAAANGARAQDESGLQPLVALWRVDALRDAASAALRGGTLAVQALQLRLDMAVVHFAGVRFGNLNTPDDLRAAGIDTH
ncbi:MULTISPECIES: molybdenum cofactor guanylyltransferase [unclassified Luteimonas]